MRPCTATTRIAVGPSSSEFLAALNSLAGVYLGQKKYAEAEPLYRLLLALRESSAAPDHPLAAFTLDKMVNFYVAQERYSEAQPLSERALARAPVWPLRRATPPEPSRMPSKPVL